MWRRRELRSVSPANVRKNDQVLRPAAGRYDAAVTKVIEMDPFQIHELENGSYELWLFDGDMEKVEDVFHDHGAEGNGHGWQAFAWALVDSKLPDLSEVIWFDSEGGTFVAGSDDVTALQRLVVLLHAAFHDHSLLAQLIRETEIN